MPAQTNDAVLPDPQTAYNNLFQGIRARVFFNKLAAAGYVPRNHEEASWMMEITGKLRTIAESQPVKTAQDANNPLFLMNNHLDKVMQQHGIVPASTHAEVENGYKSAADELMKDPFWYNSVLSLKAADAEAVRVEFDAIQKGKAA